MACRINLAPLAGIALLAAGIRAWDDCQRMHADSRSGDGRLLSTLLQATLFRLLVMGLVTIAVFRVAQPYAFGGTSLLDFTFAEKWRDNMRTIQLLIGGAADYPPGHQWANRTPFVFPFVNMVNWGLGLPLGLTAWAGWAVATWQVLRALTLSKGVAQARPHILPVAWIGGMFLWQGLQYRPVHALPAAHLPAAGDDGGVVPVVAGGEGAKLETAKLEARSGRTARRREAGNASRRQLPASSFLYAAYALLAGVTILTMLWGWGFLAIYRRPLSRITARAGSTPTSRRAASSPTSTGTSAAVQHRRQDELQAVGHVLRADSRRATARCRCTTRTRPRSASSSTSG